MSSGASTPPDVPDPSEIAQITSFTTASSSTARNGTERGSQRLDLIVTGRPAPAGRPDRRCRPPGRPAPATTSRWILAGARRIVLGRIDRRRHPCRERAMPPGPRRCRRPAPVRRANAGSAGTGNSGPAPSRNRLSVAAVALASATGMKLRGLSSKSKSSTASTTSRHRRCERRRHAAGRAGHQQRLALRRGQVKQLRRDRIERAAGHDDRPLGAERPTRTDRDRGRDRLQQRDARLDAAAPQQDRLQRFGNAVAADALRPVARAITPMMRQPTTGTATAAIAPSVWVAGETDAVDQRWKKKRLVKSPMSRSSASATNALTAPTTIARSAIGMTTAIRGEITHRLPGFGPIPWARCSSSRASRWSCVRGGFGSLPRFPTISFDTTATSRRRRTARPHRGVFSKNMAAGSSGRAIASTNSSQSQRELATLARTDDRQAGDQAVLRRHRGRAFDQRAALLRECELDPACVGLPRVCARRGHARTAC